MALSGNLMSTRFFTNHGQQTLFAKFEGVFSSNKDLEAFDALVDVTAKSLKRHFM